MINLGYRSHLEAGVYDRRYRPDQKQNRPRLTSEEEDFKEKALTFLRVRASVLVLRPTLASSILRGINNSNTENRQSDCMLGLGMVTEISGLSVRLLG
jgi:hypothetical protein